MQFTATTETEWTTEIGIQGTYSGPTDIIATDAYRLVWDFSPRGRAISLEVSPFRVGAKNMSYEWAGTVAQQ